MAKRRAKNEGSVFYRKDKKLWVGQITLPDGQKITKYAKTQGEVKDWLLTQRTAYKNGVLVSNKVTVGEYLDRWRSEVVKYQVRESTFETQGYIIEKHIKPTLGEVLLTKLTPSHLQNLIAQKLEEGYSRRTVKFIHTIMNQMLTQAKSWGLVGTNIAEVVAVPKEVKKPFEVLTQEQVNHFLDVVKTDRLYPLYVVLLSTGLRRGEALGLKWENVDLENGVLSVKGIITNVRGKTTYGEPKTPASRRLVGIPEYTRKLLIELKRNSESEFVFCTSRGTPYNPSNILKYFKKSAEKAGLPAETNIHSLRHFFTSYALSQNVPIRDVQATLGHTDPKFTLSVYSHIMQGSHTRTAEKMNDLFVHPMDSLDNGDN